MADEDILKILKTDLQIVSDKLDEYLKGLITSAKGFVQKEGISLQDTVEDGMLVEMYAAYLYRKRRAETAAMPRMLRWAMNNRLLSQKAGEQ